jgi:hypothetical protein
LFLTRLVNGKWSDPKPLDFVNTEQDDQFVSVSALGRYLIKESPGARKNSELVEFLIPDDLRPKGIMKVEGSVVNEDGAALPAYITVSDVNNGKRVYSGRPSNNGSYYVYIREGTQYNFSVDPEQSQITYFMKHFDLSTDKIPQREKLNVVLKQPVPGDVLTLDGVQFKPGSAELEPSSESELKKLVRLIKANPQINFEIQVLLNGYEQDSLKSSPELTEIMIDSVHTQIDEVDSIGQKYSRDTVIVETIYHNDRTQLQAKKIVDFLVAGGANGDNLLILTNAIPATLPEDRKLTVKAMAKSK